MDSNSESSGGKSKLVFEQEMCNFGKIKPGEVVGKSIQFENTGNGALVIDRVKTSCGCMEVKLPNKPTLPAENGKLEVIFDTRGFHGRQVKLVKVFSNDSVNKITELTIWADIIDN